MSFTLVNGTTTTGHISTGSSSSAATYTLAFTLTAGNLLVVGVSASGASATFTVSDSVGNTYTQVTFSTAATNPRMAIFYTVAATGGASIVVSVLPSGAEKVTFGVMEFSFTGSLSVDVSGSNNIGSAATSITAPTLTPTTTDLIVYCASTFAASTPTTWSAATGMTLMFNGGGDANGPSAATAYKTGVSTAITPTETMSGLTSGTWSAGAVGFKSVVAGGIVPLDWEGGFKSGWTAGFKS